MLKKKSFWIIAVVTFLASITLNFGHTVTPTYINDLGIAKKWFGYFFSVMSLGHLIMSPINGYLSDKYGRKVVMIFGFIGYAIAQSLFITFGTGPTLLLPRIIAGVFGNAVLMSTVASFTDVSTKEERTKALSIYAGLLAFGIAVAYLISGNLSEHIGVINTFKVQVGISLSMALITLLIVKNNRQTDIKERKNIFQNFKMIHDVKSRDVYVLLFLLIPITIAFVTTTKFLDVYITDNGYSKSDLGNFMFVTGIVGIIATFVFLPILNRYFRSVTLLKISLIIGGIFVIITFMQSNIIFALYSLFLVYIFFKSFYEPLDQSILSKRFDGNQGTILGIRKSFYALGNVLGPLLAGFIYEENPVAVFYMAGGLLIIAGLVIVLLIRKTKEETLKVEV